MVLKWIKRSHWLFFCLSHLCLAPSSLTSFHVFSCGCTQSHQLSPLSFCTAPQGAGSSEQRSHTSCLTIPSVYHHFSWLPSYSCFYLSACPSPLNCFFRLHCQQPLWLSLLRWAYLTFLCIVIWEALSGNNCLWCSFWSISSSSVSLWWHVLPFWPYVDNIRPLTSCW